MIYFPHGQGTVTFFIIKLTEKCDRGARRTGKGYAKLPLIKLA